MDLRSIQKPLKEKYRGDPNSSRIILKAHSAESDTPIACSVEVGQKVIEAQAHRGVGSSGGLCVAYLPTGRGGDGNPC
jgi:hypothetical protein